MVYQEVHEKMENLNDLDVKILNTAKREFEDFGFHGANVDNIADKLGIGKGTIYRHFGMKSTLLLFTVAFSFKLSAELLEKVSNELNTFEEALDKYITNLIEHHRVGGDFMRGVFTFSGENKIIFKFKESERERIQRIMYYVHGQRERSIKYLKDIIEKGIEEGKVDADIDSLAYAEIAFISINSCIKIKDFYKKINENIGKKLNAISDEDIESLKDFIKRGITHVV